MPNELLIDHAQDAMKAMFEHKIEKSIWSYKANYDGADRYYVVVAKVNDWRVIVHVALIVFPVHDYRSLKEVSEALHDHNDETCHVFNQWTNPELN